MLVSRVMRGMYRLGWMGSIKKFHLPDLGEKIKEGTVKKWYVKEGDSVTEFQKIADIASDKQFTELTSTDTGKIHKILHQEESVCQVGQLLLEIELPDSKPSASKASSANKSASDTLTQQTHKETQQPKEQQKQSSQQPSKGHIQATPAVRSLLRQHKINPKDVKGTGKNGRVLKEDVLNFLESKKHGVKQPEKTTQIKKTVAKQHTSHVIQMKNFERGMQKTMTESNKIPHLLFFEEVDMTELTKMREIVKKSSGKSLTFMTFFLKFFSTALLDYPILNSTYNPEKPFEYTRHDDHNITIAIDSKNGLAVPNIKNVQNLSLIQIQEEILRLRKLADDSKLSRSDLENGTISISNIGAVGVGTYAGPLILPPQVCIVAIGSTKVLPRYENENYDKVVPKKIMPLSFACDHRVIDGGTIAKFALRWKSLLENPYNIIASLK